MTALHRLRRTLCERLFGHLHVDEEADKVAAANETSEALKKAVPPEVREASHRLAGVATEIQASAHRMRREADAIEAIARSMRGGH